MEKYSIFYNFTPLAAVAALLQWVGAAQVGTFVHGSTIGKEEEWTRWASGPVPRVAVGWLSVFGRDGRRCSFLPPNEAEWPLERLKCCLLWRWLPG